MSLGYFECDRVFRVMESVYASRKPSDATEPQLLLTPSNVVEIANRLNGITGEAQDVYQELAAAKQRIKDLENLLNRRTAPIPDCTKLSAFDTLPDDFETGDY